jgi:hypothetical protein
LESDPIVKYEPIPIEVTLEVDFGPANKSTYKETFTTEEGATPKDVVSQVFPIRSGISCCSHRDVREIDGVANDPTKNQWWICKINGAKTMKGFPHAVKVEPGDVVTWCYIQVAEQPHSSQR